MLYVIYLSHLAITAKTVSHSKKSLKWYKQTGWLPTQDCLSLDVIDQAGHELQYPPVIDDHEVTPR